MNLYDPLLERDVDGIRAATREYRRDHTSDELFQAVARFALLAYSPSQHGKHAVISCLSARELRGETGERYDDLLTLRTILVRTTHVKIEHRYELLRGSELLAEGETTLACIDRNGKVQALPDILRLPDILD